MTDQIFRNVWKGAALNLQHKHLMLRAPDIAANKSAVLQLGSSAEDKPAKAAGWFTYRVKLPEEARMPGNGLARRRRTSTTGSPALFVPGVMGSSATSRSMRMGRRTRFGSTGAFVFNHSRRKSMYGEWVPAPQPPEVKYKKKPYCEECGGNNVTQNADVEWDVEAQDWAVVGNLHDEFFCHDCDTPTSICFEPIGATG